ncbi:spike base protein, RCAP_Rcc01079 family [Pseudogemmobacter sonorensis]|uniref:spike base protein, RCAP_Rcc01079 family n=1 Tax=Pseudogemmobacter sonorensis TaxID=2989681 RepID=UPI0036907D07
MPEPVNYFRHHARGLDSPATGHAAITPSDSEDLPVIPRVIYCATAGTAVLQDAAGVVVSYPVEAGQILPISPRRVLAASTASLVGWW